MSAGRPTKYTPDRVKRIIDALAAGNTRGCSAAYGGITMETLLQWEKRYSEFSEQTKDAEARAEVAHVANIAKASREGIWTASAWWLERRKHKDWGKLDRVDLTSDGQRIAFSINVSGSTADDDSSTD